MGRTVPMEKLDTLVTDHIELRLLQPARLEEILSSVLDRREERAERRTAHIAALRKRAAETDAKLKRLYDAIENGVADLADPMLKDRIAELKATRDQARADSERAEGALERLGPSITPQTLKTFARTASGCAWSQAATAATTSARSPNASKWTRKKFVSWGPKADCCVRSSPLQAQKRRVLACPALYRSGAPDKIRTVTFAFGGKRLSRGADFPIVWPEILATAIIASVYFGFTLYRFRRVIFGGFWRGSESVPNCPL
jgi:hypothetical protein